MVLIFPLFKKIKFHNIEFKSIIKVSKGTEIKIKLF